MFESYFSKTPKLPSNLGSFTLKDATAQLQVDVSPTASFLSLMKPKLILGPAGVKIDHDVTDDGLWNIKISGNALSCDTVFQVVGYEYVDNSTESLPVKIFSYDVYLPCNPDYSKGNAINTRFFLEFEFQEKQKITLVYGNKTVHASPLEIVLESYRSFATRPQRDSKRTQISLNSQVEKAQSRWRHAAGLLVPAIIIGVICFACIMALIFLSRHKKKQRRKSVIDGVEKKEMVKALDIHRESPGPPFKKRYWVYIGVVVFFEMTQSIVFSFTVFRIAFYTYNNENLNILYHYPTVAKEITDLTKFHIDAISAHTKEQLARIGDVYEAANDECVAYIDSQWVQLNQTQNHLNSYHERQIDSRPNPEVFQNMLKNLQKEIGNVVAAARQNVANAELNQAFDNLNMNVLKNVNLTNMKMTKLLGEYNLSLNANFDANYLSMQNKIKDLNRTANGYIADVKADYKDAKKKVDEKVHEYNKTVTEFVDKVDTSYTKMKNAADTQLKRAEKEVKSLKKKADNLYGLAVDVKGLYEDVVFWKDSDCCGYRPDFDMNQICGMVVKKAGGGTSCEMDSNVLDRLKEKFPDVDWNVSKHMPPMPPLDTSGFKMPKIDRPEGPYIPPVKPPVGFPYKHKKIEFPPMAKEDADAITEKKDSLLDKATDVLEFLSGEPPQAEVLVDTPPIEIEGIDFSFLSQYFVSITLNLALITLIIDCFRWARAAIKAVRTGSELYKGLEERRDLTTKAKGENIATWCVWLQNTWAHIKFMAPQLLSMLAMLFTTGLVLLFMVGTFLFIQGCCTVEVFVGLKLFYLQASPVLMKVEASNARIQEFAATFNYIQGRRIQNRADEQIGLMIKDINEFNRLQSEKVDEHNWNYCVIYKQVQDLGEDYKTCLSGDDEDRAKCGAVMSAKPNNTDEIMDQCDTVQYESVAQSIPTCQLPRVVGYIYPNFDRDDYVLNELQKKQEKYIDALREVLLSVYYITSGAVTVAVSFYLFGMAFSYIVRKLDGVRINKVAMVRELEIDKNKKTRPGWMQRMTSFVRSKSKNKMKKDVSFSSVRGDDGIPLAGTPASKDAHMSVAENIPDIELVKIKSGSSDSQQKKRQFSFNKFARKPRSRKSETEEQKQLSPRNE